MLGVTTLPPSGLTLPMEDMVSLSEAAMNQAVMAELLGVVSATLSQAEASELSQEDWSAALALPLDACTAHL